MDTTRGFRILAKFVQDPQRLSSCTPLSTVVPILPGFWIRSASYSSTPPLMNTFRRHPCPSLRHCNANTQKEDNDTVFCTTVVSTELIIASATNIIVNRLLKLRQTALSSDGERIVAE